VLAMAARQPAGSLPQHFYIVCSAALPSYLQREFPPVLAAQIPVGLSKPASFFKYMGLETVHPPCMKHFRITYQPDGAVRPLTYPDYA
jgi:hypothetical protein